MPRYRVPITVVTVAATAFLTVGAAEADVAPDYQDSQMMVQELTEPDYQDSQMMVQELTEPGQASPPEAVTGERAANYLDRLAQEQAAAGTEGQVPNYPGGAGGTSNGDRSAAELGEPVGAGGTSGGSMSPFALASKR